PSRRSSPHYVADECGGARDERAPQRIGIACAQAMRKPEGVLISRDIRAALGALYDASQRSAAQCACAGSSKESHMAKTNDQSTAPERGGARLPQLGFLGMGAMGSRLAARLLAAG